MRWPWGRRAALPQHLVAGAWGERRAEAYLKKEGLRVLGRRVRIGPREELDLVARDGASLVFIEVKTRASEEFGRAICAVDRHKRRMLSRAALHYLQRLKQKPPHIRFDVVEVIGRMEDEKPPLIRHTRNVFCMTPAYRITW